MVLPDRPRADERSASTGRKVLLGAAAAALATGALTLGALTPPEETAALETSTTSTSTPEELDTPIDLENFTVGEIARGQPLQWERSEAFQDGFARQLVSHDGVLYLFGNRQSPWDGEAGGLLAWRSVDGVRWEAIGQVIDDGQFLGEVTSTGQGLVALESGPAGFTIWRSHDARVWTSEVVPVEVEHELGVVYPQAVGGSDRLLVVTGHVQIDTTTLLEQRIAETTGVPIDTSPYGWGTDITSEDVRVIVYGPLGIPAMTFTGDELELSEEERGWMTHGYSPADETLVWVSQTGVISGEGLGWRQTRIEGSSWIDSIVVYPGFDVVAYGYGNTGAAAWASYDNGLSWEAHVPGSPVSAPYLVHPWGEDDFVGLDANGRADVLISDDGEEWIGTELDSFFPIDIGWGAGPIGAGLGGIAVAVEGWGEPGARLEPHDPVILSRDGATLTLDFESGAARLDVGDTELTWMIYSGEALTNIRADFEERSITFLSADAGVPLASFTFDEMSNAENEYWSTRGGETVYRAFAYSLHGDDWAIQDVSSFLGDTGWIGDLAVTEDRVVALVSSITYGPGSNPGFEIWTAPIP